ncbi:MAG: phosphate/phosphite/phosphonate ABC transporter substrate-binding protein [Bdellovibrionales bacterium CG10_big_fil_rev_8_21_14_0_10_45_34]|nr:MAG: phosphate/phosphite/phosphonate ABC transporter substrate-binding protein [Bdellovibrionales bacterium CG10_big_fil_rev_8_21_14_0_10_45_34]
MRKSLHIRFSSIFLVLVSLSLAVYFAVRQKDQQPFRSNPTQSIRIGFIPGENPEKLRVSSEAFAKRLSISLGIKVEPYISEDYQGLINAMSEKKIDFAFFTAMTFVFAEKEANAKVLLKKVWATPYYYSLVAVREGSGIKSLKDLKGKKVAFVDEKSTSGYLYPMVKLGELGIDPARDFKKQVFSGSHDLSVEMLKKGEVDAIAVFSDNESGSNSALTKYGLKKFRKLWLSEPIPNDPFVVRQDFYDSDPQLTHTLMYSFIDLANAPEGNLLKKWFNVSEMKLATSAQYDPVRRMVERLGLRLTSTHAQKPVPSSYLKSI